MERLLPLVTGLSSRGSVVEGALEGDTARLTELRLPRGERRGEGPRRPCENLERVEKVRKQEEWRKRKSETGEKKGRERERGRGSGEEEEKEKEEELE